MTTWAYLDGQWVDPGRPHLNLHTQGLHYGTAVFEGIRAYRQVDGGPPEPFMSVEHLDRFLASCGTLRIDLSESRQDLEGITRELVARSGIEDDCYVRPVAFKRSLLPGVPFGVRLQGVGHGLFVTVVPMATRLGRATRLGVSTVRRVPDVSIPTRAKVSGAYVASALAVDECVAAGHDDALLLTVDGRVAEGSTSNVVARIGSSVVTPSIDQGILPGLTRKVVLELARSAGLQTIERPIELAELYAADELFLVGTGVEIAPVVTLGGVAIGSGVPGPLVLDLCDRFEKLVRNHVPRS
ncbi:aminotransferase class IV [Isoptericola jiangsuensis]|uniref:aminotransferase class IV n=1 Tax=Isoptericola jiangsuensis TaxID=548579 RepID=UPI003AAF7BBD